MKHFTKHNNFICNLQLKIGIQIYSTVDTEKKNQNMLQNFRKRGPYKLGTERS